MTMTNWNFCPNCGHRTYQHGDKGCEHIETVGHVVRVNDDGSWALKHPLAERENDRLFECTIHQDLTTVVVARLPFPQPGEYGIIENGGGWSFEPPEKARRRCDCRTSL